MKSRLATDSLTKLVVRASNICTRNTDTALAASVTSTIEDGNIKAALRMPCSDNKPAADCETTIAALKKTHPSAAPDRQFSPAQRDFADLQVTAAEVIAVIRSFFASSAGGPDDIRSPHILDLASNKEMSPTLVSSLKNFVNVLLAGHCHDDVIPVVFGASLIALEHNSGDVRHIAIGYMLRRLAVKFANNYALASLGYKQLPE